MRHENHQNPAFFNSPAVPIFGNSLVIASRRRRKVPIKKREVRCHCGECGGLVFVGVNRKKAHLQSARDELLLPEQGPVGTAILFSVFLHIPILLFFGAGISHKAMTQDITPVFEAMYTGSRVENEYYGGAQITSAETTVAPEVKTLSIG
ncbi:MAG: hypothetical protein COX52_14565, partial [Syntrophobacterales bacterium CG23_combo_of_CG06-09_8_20_14_all_48_27]